MSEEQEPQEEPKPSESEEEDMPDALFEALWNRTVEAWDDDKPHAALLQHALDHEMLPILAGRYRALINDADKGARAQKKIDGIVVAATQMLMSMKTPERTKLPWQWTASFAAICAIVILWLAFKILSHR